MNKGIKRQIHPGAAALLILVVLIVVQWVWWRGLVYRPPGSPPGGGGGGPPQGTEQINLTGRNDVIVETFAGDLEPGDTDGLGYIARFDRPTGIALDLQGNLYVADTGNHRIRKITPDGQTVTLAGTEAGFVDGPTPQARFNAPCGVCVASDGSVYVADTGNHCIRRIQNGMVSTVIGKPNSPADGKAGASQGVLLPCSIAYLPGAAPSLLVADPGGKRIGRYRLDGTLESVQEVPGPPTSVAGTPQTAVALPQSGKLLLGAQTLHDIPVEGGRVLSAVNRYEPALRHPETAIPLRAGWLVIDNNHAGVFLVRNGQAELLAGTSSSAGPLRGSQDGSGSHAGFSTLCGIASDGGKYVYIADTANNSIRRLTISDYIGR